MTSESFSWQWLRFNENSDVVMTMIMTSWHCNNDYDIMTIMIMMSWKQWLGNHDSNEYDNMKPMIMTSSW